MNQSECILWRHRRMYFIFISYCSQTKPVYMNQALWVVLRVSVCWTAIGWPITARQIRITARQETVVPLHAQITLLLDFASNKPILDGGQSHVFSNIPRPREATSVATRIGVRPSRNWRSTESRSPWLLSPWIALNIFINEWIKVVCLFLTLKLLTLLASDHASCRRWAHRRVVSSR